MSGKWHSKASVQAALVAATGAIAASLVLVIGGRIESSDTPAAPPPVVVNPIIIVPGDQGLDTDRIYAALKGVEQTAGFETQSLGLESDASAAPATSEQEIPGPSQNSRIVNLEQATGPENILLLVDTSESMWSHGTPTDVAATITRLLGTLRKHDNIAVITFDSEAVRLLPFNRYSLEQLRGHLETLRWTGRITNISHALRASVEAMQELDGAYSRIVLVSDAVHDTTNSRDPGPIVIPELKGVRLEVLLFGAEDSAEMPDALLSLAERVWTVSK